MFKSMLSNVGFSIKKKWFHNLGLVLILSIGCCVQPAGVAAQDITVINLTSNDLIYSALNDVIYASVPNSSATNPNSLTPINPTTGALGTPIAIGFNPTHVVISNNFTTIHTVFGGGVGIQPFDVSSQTLGTAFFITGGPTVKEIYSIPDRASAVLVATFMDGYSPPATGTQVWENGVKLSNVVGTGLGTGGPDLIAVDPVDGTRGYGYQNSVTSFTNWNLNIDENGVDSGGGGTLQGVMTGFDVGHIERFDGRLFNNLGEVFNIEPAFQSGTFLGGDNFLIDPGLDRLFSVSSSGTTHTMRAYDLTTLQLLDTELVTGVSGSSHSLTRFGDGLAFRTSDDQIVLVGNIFGIPEPSSFTFIAMGLLGLLGCGRRRRR